MRDAVADGVAHVAEDGGDTLIRFDVTDAPSEALERIERDAWLDSYVVAKERAGGPLQVAFALQGGAALTAMRTINFSLLNRAQGLGCDGPFLEEDIEAAVLWLRGHCAPDWRFQLVPSTLPSDFPQRAAGLGLGPKGRGPAKLYRDAAPIAPPEPKRHSGLTIEKVTDGNAHACVDVVKAAYGMPPAFTDWGLGLIGRKHWHAYAAFDDGTPVAFGLMFVKGDWAWLGWGTTLASHRGRGAQSEILRRRVSEGIANGVKHFVTECEAAPDGNREARTSFRNVLRAGFSERYVRTAYGPR